mmetsp:Transcript_23211/g.50941  ORF Transcript_23211/g.50941 Transcript_23211/m.50941 type:complete len:215 (-) Transcript_23211:478-1122(-)|eukprot:CAMPEP_0202901338 /NCGR_PEP_ID=MMETSP1392-20130828/14200_1 /ASSEMBLY_ACC=CAM_ASM_000868 /TAXON_ID=225041 /ORGANISM="Chlamydomonas chlamydogama, Strain SAG 11-48b" /LENGTH=214 /DNA_ID=CAMNT_0049587887 /DNA_START=48 /DNA_END=692 /DNA_ORIENTATION=+
MCAGFLKEFFCGVPLTGDAVAPTPKLENQERIADSSSVPEGGRIHVKVKGRYVTIVRHKGVLSCIDSVCFHAGGPLGIGDIEDLNGKDCIVCPWHYYKIDLRTGDKYYQALAIKDGKMVPGEWQSNGVKQRVHTVTEQEGGIYVSLHTTGEIESDGYACSVPCGERVLAANAAPSRALQTVGGDGKKPSGQVLAKARQAAETANRGAQPSTVQE